MAQATDLTNRNIDGFTCKAHVAKGGFAAIWKAVSPKKKTVAVKIMHPSLAKDKKACKTFFQEFKLCESFKHKGLLNYMSYGEFQNRPYIIMEFFNGPSLKTWIQSGKIGPLLAKSEEIIVHIAKALDYVHSQNIVHQDIKPENILVNEKGDIKVIDFSVSVTGIARWLPLFRKAAGSPSYMAPEQIRKKAVSSATDMYSFGATIYEFIGGKTPFTGDNQDEILKKHVNTPPQPLSKYRSDITAGLDKLVQSMLAKAVAERPHDMKTFLNRFKKVGVFREH